MLRSTFEPMTSGKLKTPSNPNHCGGVVSLIGLNQFLRVDDWPAEAIPIGHDSA